MGHTPRANPEKDRPAGQVGDCEPSKVESSTTGPPETSIETLLKRLEDQSEDVVRQAMHDLSEMGPSAAVAVPALLRFIDDRLCPPNDLAYRALNALANMPVGAEHLPQLRPLLQRDWSYCDQQEMLLPFLELIPVLLILAKMGPAAAECASDITKLLGYDDEVIIPRNKADAACTLLALTPGAAVALETLQRLVHSPTLGDRRDVAMAIEESTLSCKLQVLDLLRLLSKDSYWEISDIANSILQEVVNPNMPEQ